MEANVHAKYKAIIMLARFSGLLNMCSSTSSMGAFTMERRSTFTLCCADAKTVLSLLLCIHCTGKSLYLATSLH